jgi:hypothetical protein
MLNISQGKGDVCAICLMAVTETRSLLTAISACFIFSKLNWNVYSFFTCGKIGLLKSVRGVTK